MSRIIFWSILLGMNLLAAFLGIISGNMFAVVNVLFVAISIFYIFYSYNRYQRTTQK